MSVLGKPKMNYQIVHVIFHRRICFSFLLEMMRLSTSKPDLCQSNLELI